MPRKGENIRKRKDGRWEGRYVVYSAERQKNIMRSVYGKTYTEVKGKLIKIKFAMQQLPINTNCKSKENYCYIYDSGNKQGHDNIHFDTVAAEWLEDIRQNKKYSTYIKYKNIYQAYLHNELKDFSIFDINDEVLYSRTITLIQQKNGEQLSESIEKSIYCVINRIFDYAEIVYNIKTNRVKRRKKAKSVKPASVLCEKEQSALLNVLYTNMDIYKLGILVCISTGLRLGEICSLKWSDIDFQSRVLHVSRTVQRISAEDSLNVKTTLHEDTPKSICSDRFIPLPDALYVLICKFKNDSVYFLNCDKPFEPRTYQNKFHKYIKEAGVSDKNFHALRHTFATNLVTNGADVKSLSEILGHSNVHTTLNSYVHPTMDDKRSQLDSLFAVRGQNIGPEE